jgi:metal-sulfur cluster biosynthetic enzyme
MHPPIHLLVFRIIGDKIKSRRQACTSAVAAQVQGAPRQPPEIATAAIKVTMHPPIHLLCVQDHRRSNKTGRPACTWASAVAAQVQGAPRQPPEIATAAIKVTMHPPIHLLCVQDHRRSNKTGRPACTWASAVAAQVQGAPRQPPEIATAAIKVTMHPPIHLLCVQDHRRSNKTGRPACTWASAVAAQVQGAPRQPPEIATAAIKVTMHPPIHLLCVQDHRRSNKTGRPACTWASAVAAQVQGAPRQPPEIATAAIKVTMHPPIHLLCVQDHRRSNKTGRPACTWASAVAAQVQGAPRQPPEIATAAI